MRRVCQEGGCALLRRGSVNGGETGVVYPDPEEKGVSAVSSIEKTKTEEEDVSTALLLVNSLNHTDLVRVR